MNNQPNYSVLVKNTQRHLKSRNNTNNILMVIIYSCIITDSLTLLMNTEPRFLSITKLIKAVKIGCSYTEEFFEF